MDLKCLDKEDQQALRTLARNNRTVYVNPTGTGTGLLILDNQLVRGLKALTIEALTNDDNLQWQKIKTESGYTLKTVPLDEI